MDGDEPGQTPYLKKHELDRAHVLVAVFIPRFVCGIVVPEFVFEIKGI